MNLKFKYIMKKSFKKLFFTFFFTIGLSLASCSSDNDNSNNDTNTTGGLANIAVELPQNVLGDYKTAVAKTLKGSNDTQLQGFSTIAKLYKTGDKTYNLDIIDPNNASSEDNRMYENLQFYLAVTNDGTYVITENLANKLDAIITLLPGLPDEETGETKRSLGVTEERDTFNYVVTGQKVSK